eukprot:TRINITY_DN48433_c0_g1_i1.p2 TRINITY_DN48433_c0_g1~~TRINITY_DN48433_c0_g1_i1.p2  ORF type:complete len:256 (+),score=83.00 TRINITY_DN48433_c0_g1_i1:91-768(+)
MAARKLRILALHGHAQSAEAFKKKTGSLRTEVKKSCEWVFMDAPHQVTPGGPTEDAEADQAPESQRTWWNFTKDEATGTYSYDPASVEASMRAVDEMFRSAGPFDGVVGFSQGACLLIKLCARLAAAPGDADLPRFHFAGVIAGYLPKDPVHRPATGAEAFPIPSIHVWGETDRVISAELSSEACELFADPVTYRHGGGHFVPSDKEFRKAFRAFVEAWQQRLAQ